MSVGRGCVCARDSGAWLLGLGACSAGPVTCGKAVFCSHGERPGLRSLDMFFTRRKLPHAVLGRSSAVRAGAGVMGLVLSHGVQEPVETPEEAALRRWAP